MLVDKAKDRRRMSRAVMVSLALHGALALPFFLLQLKPQRNETDRLLVELFGMIAERQLAEKAPAPSAQKPPAPRATPTPPRPQAPRQAVDKQKIVAPESPVQVTQPDPALAAPPTPPQVNASAGASASMANEPQKRTTVNVPENDPEALRRYLAKVTKKLQGNLEYPQEVRKSGFEGVPKVKFWITRSGAVRPGSLALLRSCGYALLDANALKAVQASEPFDPPPYEFEMKTDLFFNLNK